MLAGFIDDGKFDDNLFEEIEAVKGFRHDRRALGEKISAKGGKELTSFLLFNYLVCRDIPEVGRV